jgi:type IV pilus assembly protein PilC
MSLYQFEAMNSQGQAVKDELEATSQEEAIEKIRARKLFPTSVKEKKTKAEKAEEAALAASVKRRKRVFTLGGVSSRELCTFTRQLSTLQDAGLPILRSVRILEGQLRPGVLRNSLMDVSDAIESGSTFSEALGRQPKCFDRLYCNMVRAGETGGVLESILQRLAEFMEKAQRLKKQVISAMIYPAAVITFAGGIVFGIITFIVPKFKAMFDEMEVTLPAMTRALLTVSEWLKHRWYWILAALFAVVVLYKLVRATGAGRYLLDHLKLRLPVFGVIASKSALARFTRTLGTLISSGVPILEALHIVRQTAGNEVISRAIGQVHDSIREGESIADPLAKSGICDDMVVNMVQVGEETGDLDKMLLKIADTYDEDVDNAVAGLMSLLEPVIIIILGGCVGFIVISLFLPLITIMTELTRAGGAIK